MKWSRFFKVRFVCRALLGLQTLFCLGASHAADEPLYTRLDVFPHQPLHVHGSSIVELPNGELLCGWFEGTGERTADDVAIFGARLPRSTTQWSAPFLMADVPDFPDFTPIMVIDDRERLWMFWYTVLASQWETSMMKYRYSIDYMAQEGPPQWQWQDVLHMKPGGNIGGTGIQPDDAFATTVERKLDEYLDYLISSGAYPDDPEDARRIDAVRADMLSNARGENLMRSGQIRHADGSTEAAQLGYPYFRRMGWQTRHKPLMLEGGRMIVPLYSDGLDFSLMAITDDGGRHWEFSEPIVGFGNIQPSLVQKKDGTLVAYMRDNGPAPKRLHVSESHDRGKTWGGVRDSELPNPGSGADIVGLANGHWVLIYNDLEEGRYSLAVSISTDEGKTWQYTRHLERDLSGENAYSSHYPAIIQGKDGTLHATYSHSGRRPATTADAKEVDLERASTIRYVHFDEAWIRAGDAEEADGK